MAVCWRCPRCLEVSCEDNWNALGQPLACDHCERVMLPIETQCPVCDSRNPWSRRDSLHFLCRDCGNTQTFYAV